MLLATLRYATITAATTALGVAAVPLEDLTVTTQIEQQVPIKGTQMSIICTENCVQNMKECFACYGGRLAIGICNQAPTFALPCHARFQPTCFYKIKDCVYGYPLPPYVGEWSPPSKEQDGHTSA
ncbi:hypothetical protein B0T25DRAFT_516655 [Lasiosphaeria hispida]|uniref:Uncharacterized protein n=1 Tax=Lasiosphaeria hispida TaxID=260671 RepID=A0AAJ0HLM1_9PEZI|nr:hypothetical protein B0T25DRAFT_516655 [Lasiosphaeria hispida]